MAEAALMLVSGREKAFEEEGEYYEAVIRVRLHSVASARYAEEDVRTVADRAVYAAAGAYNLANVRITGVRLVRIESEGGSGV